MIDYGSVCSGIEAASVAWESLGWQPAWFAEVDKAASMVLDYRFPHVRNLGDMTTIAAAVDRGEVDAPGVLVGGPPCQAFSIAGRRQGLSDERGQLTLVYVDILNAIDRRRIAAGDNECVAVWENVPGVLSQSDNAFGCFLAALAGDEEPLEPGERPDEGKSNWTWTWDKKEQLHRPKWPVAGVVVGPSRTVGWIVRDAQYFGLAQRRRRVFVVASARQGFDPAAILFEFDRVRRDSPPSREAGEGTTHATVPCLTSSGRGVERPGDTRGQDPVVAVDRRDAGVKWPAEVTSTLNAHFGTKQGLEDQHALGGQACSFPPTLSRCLNAGGMGRQDYETETLIPTTGAVFDDAPVAFSAKDYGGDATEDLSPTLRAMGHGDSHANGGGQMAVAYHYYSHDYAHDRITDINGINPALTAQARASGNLNILAPADLAYAIQERAVSENLTHGPQGMGVQQDIAYTLEARNKVQATAYAFQPRIARNGRGDMGDLVNALTAQAGETGKGDASPCVAYSVTGDIAHALRGEGFDASEDGTGRGTPMVAEAYRIPGNVTPYSTGDRKDALTSANDSSAQFPVMQGMAVRRLMPIECERLQGFPDNWTLIPVARYETKPRSKHALANPESYRKEPDGTWVKLAADGPRYKQIGNSMPVPVMRWLGERIDAHLTMLDILG